MWIAFAFGSAAFAGITAILAKIGIRNTDSNLATALRTGIVLVFSWIMVFIKGVPLNLFEISMRTYLFLVLSGLATGASWLCYFYALKIGDINKVTPVDKSSTVLTILLGVIFLGERITWLKAVCVALIAVGTWLMIQSNKNSTAGQHRSEKGHSWLLYAAGAAVFAALTAILGKIGIQDIDTTLGTALRTGVVLVMAWTLVLVTGTARQIRTVDRKSWFFILLSGLSTGASWLCYYHALQTGDAGVVVPIDKLSILLTVAFSYFVFRERLTKAAGLGLALITGGTLLLLV